MADDEKDFGDGYLPRFGAVNALAWTGENDHELMVFSGGEITIYPSPPSLGYFTCSSYGGSRFFRGDYVVRWHNKVFPMRSSEFNAVFEKAEVYKNV